jgi:hypothetical protein
MKSIEIATHPLGLHFSKNKITVSTVGLVPEIRRFCHTETTAQLAVSLHAPNDSIRDQLVPVNCKYGLQELMTCLRCALINECQAGSSGCDAEVGNRGFRTLLAASRTHMPASVSHRHVPMLLVLKRCVTRIFPSSNYSIYVAYC